MIKFGFRSNEFLVLNEFFSISKMKFRQNNAQAVNLSKELKLLIQAAIVTGLSCTANLFDYLTTKGWTVSDVPSNVTWHFKFFLFDLTSLSNPIVYIVFNKKLRTQVKALFGFKQGLNNKFSRFFRFQQIFIFFKIFHHFFKNSKFFLISQMKFWQIFWNSQKFFLIILLLLLTIWPF